MHTSPPDSRNHQLSDLARGTRASVVLCCEVRQGTRPWQAVRLEELSQQGFRVTGIKHPSPTLPVSIRIPGMQLMTAQVRWSNADCIGCEFNVPLHVAVFEHLVRTAMAV